MIKDQETIFVNGDKYLTRYRLINWKWFGVYLHHFHSGDGDRALHDHPWWFAFTLILWGGYREEVLKYWSARKMKSHVKTRVLTPGRINFLPHWKFHRIDRILPDTWTLLFRFKAVKSWGFIEQVDNLDVVIYEHHKTYQG